MPAFLIKENGSFFAVNDEIAIKVAEFIQCLQTIKGEQSFNENNGLDFLNIINGRALPEIEINNIADRYTAYFKTTINGTVIKDRKLYIDIKITLNSGETQDIQTIIGGIGANN